VDLHRFKSSLAAPEPPPGIPALLLALWHDGKGDWEKAHQIAQDIESREGARVHAYLHRKEGDLWNADYWYRSAGRTRPTLSLEQEWESLVTAFLQDG